MPDYLRAFRLRPALLNQTAAERRAGKLTGALRDYDAALTQKTSNALAYSSRVNAHFNNRDYAGASADFSRAIALTTAYA